jgi:hypothetical protein
MSVLKWASNEAFVHHPDDIRAQNHGGMNISRLTGKTKELGH